MKITCKLKPVPYLRIIHPGKDERKVNALGWVSLIPNGWVLTKDDPDGPLGGWWVVFHEGWMYSAETWYEAVWLFLTEYQDDKHLC